MTSATIQPSRSSAPTSSPLARPAALREVGTYLGLVTLMVVGIALALPHAGVAVILTMPTPLLAVLLITFLRTPSGHRKELWASFRLRRLGLRSWPIGLAAAAVLILAVPYGTAVLLGSADLKPVSSSADVWLNGSINIVITLAFITAMALTEEIGWRGYLLPRMQTLVSRRVAALLVGFVHGLFHLPLILMTTTYNSVGNRWIVAGSFMVLLTAAGVFYAWLVDRSGSIWPVAFAHSSVNTLIEGAGVVAVVSPVTLAYTAGESGVVTMVCVAAMAGVLLVRGRCWDTPPVGPAAPAPTT